MRLPLRGAAPGAGEGVGAVGGLCRIQQVGAFGVVELEGAGDGFEDGRGDACVSGMNRPTSTAAREARTASAQKGPRQPVYWPTKEPTGTPTTLARVRRPLRTPRR